MLEIESIRTTKWTVWPIPTYESQILYDIPSQQAFHSLSWLLEKVN